MPVFAPDSSDDANPARVPGSSFAGRGASSRCCRIGAIRCRLRSRNVSLEKPSRDLAAHVVVEMHLPNSIDHAP